MTARVLLTGMAITAALIIGADAALALAPERIVTVTVEAPLPPGFTPAPTSTPDLEFP